jgi:lipoate-protein ligase A
MKQKKMLRWIDDVPRNAVMNMSLDEMLFNEYKNEPILRTYYWDNAYTTIGYFQNSKDTGGNKFVRRFTGGLTVNHRNDISYSFIVASDFWKVYNQHFTYKNIHFAIQRALEVLGISSEVLDEKRGDISSIFCTKTFYENDLISNGRKIVGSCLRRRGNKLIVQGSIHVDLNNDNRKNFSKEFTKNIAEFLQIEIKKYNLSNYDIEYAKRVAVEKYSNPKWNNKF